MSDETDLSATENTSASMSVPGSAPPFFAWNFRWSPRVT